MCNQLSVSMCVATSVGSGSGPEGGRQAGCDAYLGCSRAMIDMLRMLRSSGSGVYRASLICTAQVEASERVGPPSG